jgi:hypothetical protein
MRVSGSVGIKGQEKANAEDAEDAKVRGGFLVEL